MAAKQPNLSAFYIKEHDKMKVEKGCIKEVTKMFSKNKMLKTFLVVILLVIAGITAKLIADNRDKEPVYYIVDESGEQVSSFKLSQIEVGMTLKEVEQLLKVPGQIPFSSKTEGYEVYSWKLSDGSILYVNYDIGYSHALSPSDAETAYVESCSIYTPVINNDDPYFPQGWIDSRGGSIVSREAYLKVKKGMTFEEVASIIYIPGYYYSGEEDGVYYFQWQTASGKCFEIEFVRRGEWVEKDTLFARNMQVVDEFLGTIEEVE